MIISLNLGLWSYMAWVLNSKLLLIDKISQIDCIRKKTTTMYLHTINKGNLMTVTQSKLTTLISLSVSNKVHFYKKQRKPR